MPYREKWQKNIAGGTRRDKDARPRAVMLDGRVIGFLMYDASNNDEALLYRFMIDSREQGRGYGRSGLAALLDERRGLRRRGEEPGWARASGFSIHGV